MLSGRATATAGKLDARDVQQTKAEGAAPGRDRASEPMAELPATPSSAAVPSPRRPQWLTDAHQALDGAAEAAYGRDAGIPEEEAPA